MLINTTISIDDAAAKEWLQWMKEVYFPDALSTGLLKEAKIARIHAEEEGGKAYAIQMRAKDKGSYQQYIDIYAPKLNQQLNFKFQGKVVMFSTILEIVHEVSNDG